MGRRLGLGWWCWRQGSFLRRRAGRLGLTHDADEGLISRGCRLVVAISSCALSIPALLVVRFSVVENFPTRHAAFLHVPANVRRPIVAGSTTGMRMVVPDGIENQGCPT